MKIGVVGAGIIGSSIAYHLGKAGARVTVFDIGKPGNGVPSTSLHVSMRLAKPKPTCRLGSTLSSIIA